MTNREITVEIQKLVHEKPDGIFGAKTRAGVDRVANGDADAEFQNKILSDERHHVIASSFADPADVAAFRRCKAQGRSDRECFALGDNGIGCWGDDTTAPTPMCALPPEDMEEKWGSVAAAKHKRVNVEVNGKSVICILADRMPRRKNIRNGCGIDLSPAAVKAFGLKTPLRVAANWMWV